MMQIDRHRVDIATDGSGNFTGYLPESFGRLLQYRYVPDGTSPLATGADLDIVGASSGFVYVNQDDIGTSAFQRLPRHATHDETGAASLYAAAGEPVEDAMAIGGEALKVTIAQGGASKLGVLYVWIGR